MNEIDVVEDSNAGFNAITPPHDPCPYENTEESEESQSGKQKYVKKSCTVYLGGGGDSSRTC